MEIEGNNISLYFRHNYFENYTGNEIVKYTGPKV